MNVLCVHLLHDQVGCLGGGEADDATLLGRTRLRVHANLAVDDVAEAGEGLEEGRGKPKVLVLVCVYSVYKDDCLRV